MKFKNKSIRLTSSYVALFLIVMSGLNESSEAARLNFDGTMIEPPPCTINGGSPINVDFGNEVMTTRVDGKNYIKDVNYSLQCSGATSKTLRLQIKGTGASFDSTKLATDKADLAIALTANGSALQVNKWLNYNDPSKPALKAVPVKKDGATLTGGAFRATATMMIDYQ
ncbi:fimbrial protein [Rahnella sp. EDr1-12]|uniref:fimbrial protein n=1 Tax=unclassified Rahnella TaxID=2635087 RepID=UPI003BA92094